MTYHCGRKSSRNSNHCQEQKLQKRPKSAQVRPKISKNTGCMGSWQVVPFLCMAGDSVGVTIFGQKPRRWPIKSWDSATFMLTICHHVHGHDSYQHAGQAQWPGKEGQFVSQAPPQGRTASAQAALGAWHISLQKTRAPARSHGLRWLDTSVQAKEDGALPEAGQFSQALPQGDAEACQKKVGAGVLPHQDRGVAAGADSCIVCVCRFAKPPCTLLFENKAINFKKFVSRCRNGVNFRAV